MPFNIVFASYVNEITSNKIFQFPFLTHEVGCLTKKFRLLAANKTKRVCKRETASERRDRDIDTCWCDRHLHMNCNNRLAPEIRDSRMVKVPDQHAGGPGSSPITGDIFSLIKFVRDDKQGDVLQKKTFFKLKKKL